MGLRLVSGRGSDMLLQHGRQRYMLACRVGRRTCKDGQGDERGQATARRGGEGPCCTHKEMKGGARKRRRIRR